MFDFRPLRSATFRRLLATYSINELGNWIGEIALAVIVFDRTHSPLATAGLFLAIKFVPAILASFLTTAIVTRRPGTTLAVLYIVEAVLFAGMAVVSAHFLLAAMLVLAGIDAVLATAATALRRSVTATRLLADDLLREGNAIINIGFTAASAIGPALAGVLVAASGPGGALWVDAASFALVAVVIVGVRDPAADASSEGGAMHRLRTGLTEVWRRREVRGLLGALAVGLMFGSIVIPIEVVFAKQTLHAGATGYGALLACWGVGMILGGVGFAATKRVPIEIVLLAGASLIAAGYGGISISSSLAAACAFSALGGLGNGAGSTAALTAIQAATPVASQAVVMWLFEGINLVMPSLGFVLGGVIADLSTPRNAYAASAIGLGLVVAIGASVKFRSVATAAPVPDTSVSGID